MPATQNISLTSPTDYSAESLSIERRRKLAEALQAQANQPLDTNQTAGGFVIPISPFQGAAKLSQALVGAYGSKNAEDASKGLSERRNQALIDALGQMPQGGTVTAPTDQEGTGSFDMSGAAGPQVTRTAPTPQQNASWLGQIANIDPKAVDIGKAVLTLNQQAQEKEADRQAKSMDRIMTLEAAAQNASLSREERAARAKEAADLRRELQASTQEFSRQASADRRAMTPPPQAQIVQTDQGIFERGRDGALKPLTDPATGKPLQPKGADKPMTEFQGKSSLYGTRAQAAHDAMLDLESNISTTGLAAKNAAQNVPLIGGALGMAGNAMLSPNQQRVEQAQRDFVNAVLRQESGAAIGQSEFLNAQRQYFPQPNDSKEVIEQKRRNRELAIAGFERSAGKEGGQAVRDVRAEGADRRKQSAAPNPGRRGVDAMEEADRILQGK